ncbi:Uncharacterised protein [Paucimonas lemoignei]|jgi:hypothetical protein|nr:Uncharacterised protein [Paucimonas lemoignei]
MNRKFFQYRPMSSGDRRRARMIASGCFALAGISKVIHEVTVGADVLGVGLAVALFAMSGIAAMSVVRTMSA